MSDEAETTETKYGLLVSFEDQSPSYVHGFEAGMLWHRMEAGAEAEIELMVHSANRETINRMAIAKGWTATFAATEYDEWLNLELVKAKKAPELPNPHGLRVVA